MPDLGTATTITFGTSSATLEVRDISHDGIERVAIDSSHLSTSAARTFLIGDLYDPGTLELEVLHDPADIAPFSAAAETITITAPDSSTVQGTGAVVSYSMSYPLEDLMVAQISIKFSGALTFA